MMLNIEGGDGLSVKRPLSERMVCLNAKRSTGKYHKQCGMKRSLRSMGRRCFRGVNHLFRPWKDRWRFFNGKYYDGRWRRGEAYRYSCKRSVLFRSGKERVYLDSRISGRRSLFNHPACFHPEKHRVDFYVWVNECRQRNEQEFGIACELDGVYNIDHVAVNLIVFRQSDHGHWSCAECFESGDLRAELGYVKATFDSKQALLLDHMKPTLDGIRYLCWHGDVNVWLDCPNDPSNSSSAVVLKSGEATKKCEFSIPIGAVKMSPLKANASETSVWIHQELSKALEQEKRVAPEVVPLDRAWLTPLGAKILAMYFGIAGHRKSTLEEIGHTLGLSVEDICHEKDDVLNNMPSHHAWLQSALERCFMYWLFIDDERPLPDRWKSSAAARSSDEAIALMDKRGCPRGISFDHDLGGDDTAMRVVNWMIKKDMDER